VQHAGRGVEPLDGQLARRCGLVTVRQRPATGNGNVIIWPSPFEQQRREVISARRLGAYVRGKGVYTPISSIVQLTPLCIKCLCEAETSDDHGYSAFSRLTCVKFRHKTDPIDGSQFDIKARVTMLIRQKLRSGEWEIVVSELERRH